MFSALTCFRDFFLNRLLLCPTTLDKIIVFTAVFNHFYRAIVIHTVASIQSPIERVILHTCAIPALMAIGYYERD